MVACRTNSGQCKSGSSSLNDVDREVNEWIHHFFGTPVTTTATSGRRGGWRAPASLWSDDERYYLEIDLPGVSQEDVEITVDKGTLRIAAERKPVSEKRAFLHREHVYGKVERTATLPDDVDPDSVEAELSAGVLSVTLSKKPEAQPKRIEIKGS